MYFVEMYKKTLCNIKKMHEWEEISGGKCLALYYDFKGNDGIQSGKKEVSKRVGYIVSNPDKFDKNLSAEITKATVEIGACNEYIKSNCM